jgi:hypothetical protein
MTEYLVCTRKRNAPRLDIRVCRERCAFKDQCREYTTRLKNPTKDSPASLSQETPASMAAP